MATGTSTPSGPEASRPGHFLLTGEGWPYLLVPLIPVAVVLELLHAAPTWVFLASALGVIPTAALMGRATEELSARSGPGIGGFLNVTFGNAPELIIALFALGAGLHEVVKASLVGSILGNILLVLGVSMLAGGLRRDRQDFEFGGTLCPCPAIQVNRRTRRPGEDYVRLSVFVPVHGEPVVVGAECPVDDTRE